MSLSIPENNPLKSPIKSYDLPNEALEEFPLGNESANHTGIEEYPLTDSGQGDAGPGAAKPLPESSK